MPKKCKKARLSPELQAQMLHESLAMKPFAAIAPEPEVVPAITQINIFGEEEIVTAAPTEPPRQMCIAVPFVEFSVKTTLDILPAPQKSLFD